MKVLFIGGTGVISSACSDLAVNEGVELFHLNRGNSASIRQSGPRVKTIVANVRNFDEAQQALNDHRFDVVVDWISFLPSDLENNFKLFEGKTSQYIFISSASAYQTPPSKLPVTENTPLDNPFWQYSRNKIECEQFVKVNAPVSGFRYTIVRPSHTYDKTTIPVSGGHTTVNRMLQGKPVFIMGDGTSVWTLTYHRDFAVGLVGLLGNPMAMDETFHITSDEWLTWNQIYGIVANRLGVDLKVVHIPSDFIARYDDEFGSGLLGDKSHSMIFDNTKIKQAVPAFTCNVLFREGVRESIEWYLANPSLRKIDARLDLVIDKFIADYSIILK